MRKAQEMQLRICPPLSSLRAALGRQVEATEMGPGREQRRERTSPEDCGPAHGASRRSQPMVLSEQGLAASGNANGHTIQADTGDLR